MFVAKFVGNGIICDCVGTNVSSNFRNIFRQQNIADILHWILWFVASQLALFHVFKAFFDQCAGDDDQCIR